MHLEGRMHRGLGGAEGTFRLEWRGASRVTPSWHVVTLLRDNERRGGRAWGSVAARRGFHVSSCDMFGKPRVLREEHRPRAV